MFRSASQASPIPNAIVTRAQASRAKVTYRCPSITSTDKPRPKNAITANVSMLITPFLSFSSFADLMTDVGRFIDPTTRFR
jgi:hypothetical protein